MSRYRPDPREYASRDAPPNRWDADRFAREREYRDSGNYYDGYYEPEPPRRARPAAPVAPVYDDRRYYEEDIYGPRGSRVERRYFEEDDYYDPRSRQGQMVPFRGPRQAPPRPGLLRRQSSLDTFDRPRRDNEYGRRPTRIDFEVPELRDPRENRYRRQPGRREYYEEYDDIQVQDPDYYGDEGFREYREREWVRSRRRDDSEHSRSRSRQRPETVIDDHKSEVIDERKSTTEIDDRRSEATKVSKKEIKIEAKTEKKEKPFPRRGKTKMPKRLVHTKVLFDLGYPFYEENEKTIIIEKALGPDNIDEVIMKSKEYRGQEVSNTRLLEAPPASSHTTTVRSPSPPPAPPTVRSERKTVIEEEIKTKPLSEAPRSVREWDNMTAKTSGSHRSRKSKSRAPSSSAEESIRETIIDKKSVVDREPSPSRTHRTSRSKARSSRRESVSSSSTEIVERRIVREEEDVGYDFDESATVNVGPLAMARAINKPRSDRDIQEEIELLRAERRGSRRKSRRRHRDRDSEVFIERVERRRSPSVSSDEVLVERIVRSPSRRRSRGDVVVEHITRSPSPRRSRNELIVERMERSPSRVRERDLIVERIDRSPSPRRRPKEEVFLERMARSRSRSRSISPVIRTVGELKVDRRGDEIIETKKERRERSRSRPPSPPSSRLIKGLIYAAT